MPTVLLISNHWVPTLVDTLIIQGPIPNRIKAMLDEFTSLKKKYTRMGPDYDPVTGRMSLHDIVRNDARSELEGKVNQIALDIISQWVDHNTFTNEGLENGDRIPPESEFYDIRHVGRYEYILPEKYLEAGR